VKNLSFTFVFAIAVKHEQDRQQTLFKRNKLLVFFLINVVQCHLATFVALRLADSNGLRVKIQGPAIT